MGRFDSHEYVLAGERRTSWHSLALFCELDLHIRPRVLFGRAGIDGAYFRRTIPYVATLRVCNSSSKLTRLCLDWVSEFAPRSQQKFLSYIVGWLAALGWQALIATTSYSSAVLILTMASIYHPSYAMQNWHQTLVMIAIACLATFINTYGARRLPILEGIVLVVHVFGFFCVIIPLWVLAPKASASDVFGSFTNFGGWPSIGTACFVGSITATGSFAGSDAAAHLSEECRDASKAVPRMMVGTVLLNGAMGLIFIITYASRPTSSCVPITNMADFLCSVSASPTSKPSSRRSRPSRSLT